MTKGQMTDKLYWLACFMFAEYTWVYDKVKELDELIDQVPDASIIKGYHEYKCIMKYIDMSNNKVDRYFEQFEDITKILKELAEQ